MNTSKAVPLPKQPVTGDNIKMFVHQIGEIIKDPYNKMDFKLQMSLSKLCDYLGVVARNKNNNEIDGFPRLMGEMLCLFLSAKSQLELVADCELNTESQREAARNAITEDNSELFAKTIKGVFENTKWRVLKNAPINIEEIVEILQAYKTKYGSKWTYQKAVEMDKYINIDHVNKILNASGILYLKIAENTNPVLKYYKTAITGVINKGGVVKQAKEIYDTAKKKLNDVRPESDEYESVNSDVIKAGMILGVAATEFNHAMNVFMSTEVPDNSGNPESEASSGLLDLPPIK